jgi:hypothetical protein
MTGPQKHSSSSSEQVSMHFRKCAPHQNKQVSVEVCCCRTCLQDVGPFFAHVVYFILPLGSTLAGPNGHHRQRYREHLRHSFRQAWLLQALSSSQRCVRPMPLETWAGTTEDNGDEGMQDSIGTPEAKAKAEKQARRQAVLEFEARKALRFPERIFTSEASRPDSFSRASNPADQARTSGHRVCRHAGNIGDSTGH